jgi:hypothetical protein
MNTIDLMRKKVPIRPEAVKSANKDNVVVGKLRNNKEKDKTLAREIVLNRKSDGNETISRSPSKITGKDMSFTLMLI